MPTELPRPFPANKELAETFRKATYVLDLPDGELVLHIGQPNESLKRVLSEHGASNLAILTAHNPDAQEASPEQNRQAQASLIAEAKASGLAWIEGRNIASEGDGPTESTVALIGANPEQVKALALQFTQLAYVVVDTSSVPALMWKSGDDYVLLPNA